MRLAAEWWPTLRHGLSALAGGRAPVWWSRQLARETARLADLARSGAWLGRFGTLWPTLLDQPLWGKSLGLLTAETASPPDVVEPEPDARRAPPRPQLVERPAGRLTPRVDLPVGRAAPGPAAGVASSPPTALPHQAGRALLERLSGPALPPAPPDAERVRPQPQGEALTPAVRDAADRLGQDLAQRPGQIPRASAVEGGGLPAGTKQPGGYARPELPGTVADRGVPQPAAWSTRLDGPTAPPELLVWLAGGRDQAAVAEQRGSQATQAETGEALRGENIESLARADLDGSRPFPSPVIPPSRAADVFARLREAASESGAGTMVPIEGVTPAATEIAPPALAERLPPLTLPPKQGAPGLAVAAAMAWAGAQAEAGVPDDDLDVLAAKIKRILDEEARRYGIDV